MDFSSCLFSLAVDVQSLKDLRILEALYSFLQESHLNPFPVLVLHAQDNKVRSDLVSCTRSNEGLVILLDQDK